MKPRIKPALFRVAPASCRCSATRTVWKPVPPLVGFFLLLVLSPWGFAQFGVVSSVSLSADKISLADSLQLTLAVEGAAPLRVELPRTAEQLLAPASARVWSIRPVGSAQVTPVEGGRERWEAHFRLSPFAPGEKVPLVFAPIRVFAGAERNPEEATFPSREIRVQTSIVDPKAEDVRPITGIESLPPLPGSPSRSTGWPYIAGLAAIFFLVLVAAVVRRRRQPAALPPAEWAVREVDRLDPDAGLLAADRLAAILREFVERRDRLPATQLTTAELLAECGKLDWPMERRQPLQEVLERCDRAKFAGDAPDRAELESLVGQSRAWIAMSRPAAGL